MHDVDISLMPRWQKMQYVLFALFFLLTGYFTYVVYQSLFGEGGGFHGNVVTLVWAVLLGQALLRLRYLKALYLRINDEGMSWRLIVGIDYSNNIRPPVSDATLSWKDITGIRQEATGMRVAVVGKKDELLLPLSNFSYAQRQEIKRAVAEHYGTPTPAGEDAEGDVEAA